MPLRLRNVSVLEVLLQSRALSDQCLFIGLSPWPKTLVAAHVGVVPSVCMPDLCACTYAGPGMPSP